MQDVHIKKPFREHHLLRFLEIYEQQTLPLDLSLCSYFRTEKALGAKDRGFIAETVYGMVRWRGLLDYLYTNKGSPTWEGRLQLYLRFNPNEFRMRADIPLHIRASFPKVLFDNLVSGYGEEQAFSLCLANNMAAPTTVRVNLLKTTREELLQRWKGTYDVELTPISPMGITFRQKVHFFSLPEFKEGLFEVQDEASQLIADLVRAEPGDQVLDYCAGSGGKTLAFAWRMQNQGQIYLHDIRSRILEECRKRMRRAGVQNCQTVSDNAPKLRLLKKKMDWVLVDAPCTGSGTLRRNPDMKWKFSDAVLERLVGQQRMIFEKALSYLAPGGKIVYATCSLLKEENEAQISHFLKTYSLHLDRDPFQSLPSPGGMDGFFGAILKR